MEIEKIDKKCFIKMIHGEEIEIFVPASTNGARIHLSIASDGRLRIVGTSSVVCSISGPG